MFDVRLRLGLPRRWAIATSQAAIQQGIHSIQHPPEFLWRLHESTTTMGVAQAYGIEYVRELDQGIQHMPFQAADNHQTDDKRGDSDTHGDPGTSGAESLR